MTGPGRLAGTVLIGGASSRFGRDKAWVTVEGSALAVRVARSLTDAGAAPVLAVGGSGDEARRNGLGWIPDRWPGEGPLGGVVTALDHLTRLDPEVELVAVLACDLARPDANAVRRLVDAIASRPRADVAVAVDDGTSQWHLAVWRRRALGLLAAAFDDGERSIRGAAGSLDVLELGDLDPSSMLDVDTPGDLGLAGDPAPG